MSQPNFIDALVTDLEPIRPASSWTAAMLGWCLFSWLIVGGVILATGPLRPGFATELMTSPRFALEIAFGLAASLAAIWAGLEIDVPGASSPSRFWTPPALLFAGWALVVGYGLMPPNGPQSMVGKRAHCFVETLVVALPPLIAALYLLRRRALAGTKAGVLVGVAAAAIPALWMQIACIHEPLHALKFHFSPIVVLALLGAGFSSRFGSRI